MDLLQKYNQAMSSKGQDMLNILASLTPTEQKYINAKIIIQSLEEDLKKIDPNHPFKNELYIKKQISDWSEIIQELESKQNLAVS